MNLSSIPALSDNYIWVLHNEQGHCLIVDPGDSTPLLAAITQHHWQPEAVLLTHHHQDHTGGVRSLLEHYPGLPVYGSPETQSRGASQLVSHGQVLQLSGLTFQVLATPGHTAGHLCYFSEPYLFSGDTLFSAGCGRLFEGTTAQMYQSLQMLNRLPADTLVCCGHEYTLSNLRFALSLAPQDEQLIHYYQLTEQKRKNQQRTVPATLRTERQINVFLRTSEDDFMQQLDESLGEKTAEQRFAWLRAKKDIF